jgi:hypothetical protein
MTFDPGHPALFCYQQAAARDRAMRREVDEADEVDEATRAARKAETRFRAREALEAYRDALRARGIDVDDGMPNGYGLRDGVARTHNDRRRRGRLPEEDDPSFDDVIRLFDR